MVLLLGAGHVTRCRVAHAERRHLRLLGDAPLDRDRASGAEPTPRRRRDRAGDLTVERGSLHAPVRVRPRDRLEEGLRVRVSGIAEHGVGRPGLDDLPQVHHGDAVADVLDDREVVRHEQDREP